MFMNYYKENECIAEEFIEGTMINLFLEQQIQLAEKKIDITPGFALTYFSDISEKLNFEKLK